MANADDAYGAKSIEIAQRRRTPILAFARSGHIDGPGAHRVVDESSPVVLIVRSIVTLLDRDPGQVTRAEADSTGTDGGLALVALANDAQTASAHTMIQMGSHRVCLSGHTGRAYSDSALSLKAVIDQFATSQWQLTRLPDPPAMPVSVSADSFLLDAAIQCTTVLPLIEDRPWKLSDWPDLGSSQLQASAMRIAVALLRDASRPSSLALRHNLPVETVSCYLWAFKAAGLLKPEEETVGTEAAPTRSQTGKVVTRPPGLLAKLASRFGFA